MQARRFLSRSISVLAVGAVALGPLACGREAVPSTTPAAVSPPASETPPPARQASVVETPASLQFAAWLAAFDAGDRQGLLAYHEQSFPYGVASDDVANIDREAGLSHGTGGFDVKKTENPSPTTVIATLKERHSDQFCLRFNGGRPHRAASGRPLRDPPDPYRVFAHLHGPPGDVLGRIDVLEYDGNGHLAVEQRPFVVQAAGGTVEVMTLSRSLLRK